MRKLLCAILVVALLAVPVAIVGVSAESLVDEDYILSDLMPNEDTPSDLFELTDCEVSFNRDGSFTVTITGPAPSMTLTMAEGALVHVGAIIDLSDPAYFALDFGTYGSVTLSKLIFHYTRKDKAAQDTVADLYMESMYATDYAQYVKQSDGKTMTSSTALLNDGSYIVWDWGTYITSDAEKKLFDDHRHQFTSVELGLTGAVGSSVTFYTIAVISDPDVEGLGEVRPEPMEQDEPDESEPEESSEEPVESSEESVEESSAAPAESSEAAEESSAAETSSTGSTSSAVSTSEGNEGGGISGSIIGIIIAIVAVIVIAVVVIIVVVKKKK